MKKLYLVFSRYCQDDMLFKIRHCPLKALNVTFVPILWAIMSPLLAVCLLVLVLYKLYKFYSEGVPPNSPPALPRVPFAGSYWHLLWINYKYPHKGVEYYVDKLKSKVVSCYFGPYYSVVANDYKSVKEVLTKEEFDGRLTDVDVLRARAFGKKLGIFFTDGPQWQEQRRFALRHMRDFGFGRRQEKFENDVMEETTLLVQMLKNGHINDSQEQVIRNGAALFPDALYPYSVNCIWMIMFGDKFGPSEHDKLLQFCRSGMLFQRAADTSGGAIFQRPFLKYFGNLFGYDNIMKGNYGMVDFIKEHLVSHRETHDDNRDRGLIDRYWIELKKRNEPSWFSEEQLIMILTDFMFPAITAIPTMLTHAIKYMMHYPEVSRKVREEINTVVGTGRFVTWEDRKNLPYTEATLRELMRYETLTPFGVIHRSTRQATLCGYNVPSNTVVVTNLAGMNHDRDFWGDPENFRPERFLNEENQLAKDPTFPFGFGHRVCAGETFARYVMFGAFAVLMQNFNFLFIDGQPTSLEDKLPGLIVTPKDTWIRLVPRG